MNDDDPTEVREHLKRQHRELDSRIETLSIDPEADQLEIARLKKQKLRLKDEIEAISDRIVPDIIA